MTVDNSPYTYQSCRDAARTRWAFIKASHSTDEERESAVTRAAVLGFMDILHNLLVREQALPARWRCVELMMLFEESFGVSSDSPIAYEEHGWPSIPDYHPG